AVDAMRSLIALEDKVLERAGRPATLTAAPPLSGLAFVELGVDGESGPELQHALSTLGFCHTGQHRSKPVQLWQEGRARIVLNSNVVRSAPDYGSTAITAFAVESDDPTASAH